MHAIDAPDPELALLMALREFSDSRGVRWLVWDVIPDWVDRRRGRDRRSAPRPDSAERRQRYDAAVLRRLARTLGWLVFESRLEKRRFRPLPDEWDRLPEPELERMLAKAESAGRPRLLG